MKAWCPGFGVLGQHKPRHTGDGQILRSVPAQSKQERKGAPHAS